MQRLNAASCLLIALLSGAAVCLAAEHVRVEVVQTHTGVRLGSCGREPVTDSDAARSQCNRNSGGCSRELGFHCGQSSVPSPEPAESRRDSAFFYHVRVIMPNAARLVFYCSTILDQNCAGFPDYPENTSVECSDFVDGGRAYKDCTASGPVAGSIGVYRAALHGDRMTIFGPNWRRNYLQYGTWQLDAVAAQDPKPAPTKEEKPAQDAKPVPAPSQEPKPAPDSKPDAPQETKPAAPQETRPDALPDTKADAPDSNPAPAGAAITADSNGDVGPRPALTPAGAEQVVDPRVIEQAKAGDAKAQYKLGYDYFLGRGVPLDYVQAAIWWRKAADQGFPEAQNNLGVLYNSGKGVPQSFAEAYFWQNLAASRARGLLQAQFAKNRDESASKLWLLSRLRVQQRAAKWAADHPVAPRSHEPPEEKRGEYP
jgi:Sel1 repeat